MKTRQNKTEKTQNFPQKITIRFGAWPTQPLSSFSRIIGFFKLDKTPKATYIHATIKHIWKTVVSTSFCLANIYLIFHIEPIHNLLWHTNTITWMWPGARILVQVTIYRRLLIGRHLDQSEAYDIIIVTCTRTWTQLQGHHNHNIV